jgi:hypothetical protein
VRLAAVAESIWQTLVVPVWQRPAEEELGQTPVVVLFKRPLPAPGTILE